MHMDGPRQLVHALSHHLRIEKSSHTWACLELSLTHGSPSAVVGTEFLLVLLECLPFAQATLRLRIRVKEFTFQIQQSLLRTPNAS